MNMVLASGVSPLLSNYKASPLLSNYKATSLGSSITSSTPQITNISTTQSKTTPFGGYGSAEEQRKAEQKLLSENISKYPEQFKNFSSKNIEYVKAKVASPTMTSKQAVENISQPKPVTKIVQIQDGKKLTPVFTNLSFNQNTPSLFGEFVGGVTGTFQDMGGFVVDPNYQTKSPINKGLDAVIEGVVTGKPLEGFQQAGNILYNEATTNPAKFAGALVTEVGLAVIPIGPALKAIKGGSAVFKMGVKTLSDPNIIKNVPKEKLMALEGSLDALNKGDVSALKSVKAIVSDIKQTAKQTEVLGKMSKADIANAEKLIAKADAGDKNAIKKVTDFVKQQDLEIQKEINTQVKPLYRTELTANRKKFLPTRNEPLGSEDPFTILPGGLIKANPTTIKQQELKAINELNIIANDPTSSATQRLNAQKLLEQYAKAGVVDRDTQKLLNNYVNAKNIIDEKRISIQRDNLGLLPSDTYPYKIPPEAINLRNTHKALLRHLDKGTHSVKKKATNFIDNIRQEKLYQVVDKDTPSMWFSKKVPEQLDFYLKKRIGDIQTPQLNSVKISKANAKKYNVNNLKNTSTKSKDTGVRFNDLDNSAYGINEKVWSTLSKTNKEKHVGKRSVDQFQYLNPKDTMLKEIWDTTKSKEIGGFVKTHSRDFTNEWALPLELRKNVKTISTGVKDVTKKIDQMTNNQLQKANVLSKMGNSKVIKTIGAGAGAGAGAGLLEPQLAYGDTGEGLKVGNVLGDFGTGLKNQAVDYQGIVNWDYKNQSILNQAIDKVIEGDLDGAGKLIGDNSARFAGNVVFEAGTAIVPVGAVMKAAKGSQIAGKIITKGRQQLTKGITKGDEIIDKTVRYNQYKKIQKGGKKISEEARDEFLINQKTPLENISTKIGKGINKINANRKTNMYQIVGTDEKGTPYYSPWYNKGKPDPVFGYKASVEATKGRSGVVIKKVKVKNKDAQKYQANRIFMGSDDSLKIKDLYRLDDIKKGGINALGDNPVYPWFNEKGVIVKPNNLLNMPVKKMLNRERYPTYTMLPIKINQKAKIIRPKNVEKQLAKELLDSGEKSKDIRKWSKSLQNKYDKITREEGKSNVNYNKVTKYMDQIRKDRIKKGITGGTVLGLSSSQKTSTLRKKNKYNEKTNEPAFRGGTKNRLRPTKPQSFSLFPSFPEAYAVPSGSTTLDQGIGIKAGFPSFGGYKDAKWTNPTLKAGTKAIKAWTPTPPILTGSLNGDFILGTGSIGVKQSGLDEFDIASINKRRQSKGQAPIQMNNLNDAIRVSAAANSAWFNTPKGRAYLNRLNIDTYNKPYKVNK